VGCNPCMSDSTIGQSNEQYNHVLPKTTLKWMPEQYAIIFKETSLRWSIIDTQPTALVTKHTGNQHRSAHQRSDHDGVKKLLSCIA
jgi:hypothetical protein